MSTKTFEQKVRELFPLEANTKEECDYFVNKILEAHAEQLRETLKYIEQTMRSSRDSIGDAYNETLSYSDGVGAHQLGLRSVISRILDFKDDLEESSFFNSASTFNELIDYLKAKEGK
jgi:hypothetical protein